MRLTTVLCLSLTGLQLVFALSTATDNSLIAGDQTSTEPSDISSTSTASAAKLTGVFEPKARREDSPVKAIALSGGRTSEGNNNEEDSEERQDNAAVNSQGQTIFFAGPGDGEAFGRQGDAFGGFFGPFFASPARANADSTIEASSGIETIETSAPPDSTSVEETSDIATESVAQNTQGVGAAIVTTSQIDTADAFTDTTSSSEIESTGVNVQGLGAAILTSAVTQADLSPATTTESFISSIVTTSSELSIETGPPTASEEPISSTEPTSDDAVGTAAAAEASSSVFQLPGRQLAVLPIGLGIFAGISVIALVIVGVVTYERRKYRKQYRVRKMREQVSAAGGFRDMAEARV